MRLIRPVRRARPARGLSLVELMVGVTIGLIIVAAASLVLATQLTDNRRLQQEMQIQQDLRAAADIVSRELRHAGYWGDAARGVWLDDGSGVLVNPYAALATGSSSVTGAYSRNAENNAIDLNEPFGFRLQDETIQTLLGLSAANTPNWQALTDRNVLRVTAFSITPTERQGQALSCPQDCAGLANCPPRLVVRELTVRIDGQAANDPSVARTVRATVRLRNDGVIGACPA